MGSARKRGAHLMAKPIVKLNVYALAKAGKHEDARACKEANIGSDHHLVRAVLTLWLKACNKVQ